MPEFTQDWFSHNVHGLQMLLPSLPARRHFLEIGCFEGLSTCWFLKHALDDVGTIVSVDTFAGGEEHGPVDYSGVRARFESNVAEMKGPAQTVEVIESSSLLALAGFVVAGRTFDFIYVDGSHTAPDVMTDACLAFPLLRPGGVMVFDDYLWSSTKHVLHTPKPAVDMFTLLFQEHVSVLSAGYQLAVQRKG